MLSLKTKQEFRPWGWQPDLALLVSPLSLGFPHCSNNEWRRYARHLAMFQAHGKMTTIDDNYK